MAMRQRGTAAVLPQGHDLKRPETKAALARSASQRLSDSESDGAELEHEHTIRQMSEFVDQSPENEDATKMENADATKPENEDSTPSDAASPGFHHEKHDQQSNTTWNGTMVKNWLFLTAAATPCAGYLWFMRPGFKPLNAALLALLPTLFQLFLYRRWAVRWHSCCDGAPPKFMQDFGGFVTREMTVISPRFLWWFWLLAPLAVPITWAIAWAAAWLLLLRLIKLLLWLLLRLLRLILLRLRAI